MFEEPAIQKETVPAPKLFSDVVLPLSGPIPNGLDKCLFNLALDFSHLLQVPTIDAPVIALLFSSHLTGPPEESLCLEDKRAEHTLIKGHQAQEEAGLKDQQTRS